MDIPLTLRPIGIIRTPFKQKFGTPRQAGLVVTARAQIELSNDHVPTGALAGLSQFSHIWLLFHFNRNTNETISGKVHPPRLGGQKMGLFATRSPHRPNPIGLSVVKLEAVDEAKGTLIVSGVDMIDGTPIFDIKPYIEQYDQVSQPESGWLEQQQDSQKEVIWSNQALQNAETLKLDSKIRHLITDVLKHDLRNQEDRRKQQPDKNYRTLLENYDVHFTQSGSMSTVTDIIKKTT